MIHHTLPEALPLTVATLPRPRLLESLQRARVHLNASAQTLLKGPRLRRPCTTVGDSRRARAQRVGTERGRCAAADLRRRTKPRAEPLPRSSRAVPSTRVALSAERTRHHHVQRSSAHGILNHRGTPTATWRGRLPEGLLHPSDRWTSLAPRLPLRPDLWLEPRRPACLLNRSPTAARVKDRQPRCQPDHSRLRVAEREV